MWNDRVIVELVQIPDRGIARPNALLGLLDLPLLDLFRQVIGVVFGHQDLDPVDELLMRLDVLRENFSFLYEMNLKVRIVPIDCGVILEIAVQAVSFFQQGRV